MHILRLLKKSRKDFQFLRREKVEAVDPDFRPFQKCRFRNLRCKRFHHIARIVVTSRHLFAVTRVEKRKVAELAAQIFILERILYPPQCRSVNTIDAEFLQCAFEGFRKSPLACRTLEGLQLLPLLAQNPLQKQPAA